MKRAFTMLHMNTTELEAEFGEEAVRKANRESLAITLAIMIVMTGLSFLKYL